jgi:hypothetical protein
MRRHVLHAFATMTALALASSASPLVRPAQACGVFADPEKHPSLAHEQVLLIHDATRERQHFIRKITFREASEPFGFVVPTPARPEVAEVTTSPFARLDHFFRFAAPPQAAETDANPKGFGRGHGRLGGGVAVVEVKEIGSFTAFILEANDLSALRKWLAENGFGSTQAGDAWLAHYVRTQFCYVALRYNPKGSGASRLVRAETLRISFDTPLPYYPYLEPTLPAGIGAKRLLELWLVTSTRAAPVALHQVAPVGRWVRPLRAGRRFDHAREMLEAALEPEIATLLPAGDLGVQTFQDQKASRKGFFDILFVPLDRRLPLRDQGAKLAPLLPILDPGLDRPTPP